MSTRDVIALRGLRVRGHHGVFDSERRDGQLFVVDAVLSVDTHPAATSDELPDTVDYGELAQRLARIVEGEPVRLLETLAERLAAECLVDERVEQAEISVHKPAAPVPVPVDDVVVTIVRSRR